MMYSIKFDDKVVDIIAKWKKSNPIFLIPSYIGS